MFSRIAYRIGCSHPYDIRNQCRTVILQNICAMMSPSSCVDISASWRTFSMLSAFELKSRDVHYKFCARTKIIHQSQITQTETLLAAWYAGVRRGNSRQISKTGRRSPSRLTESDEIDDVETSLEFRVLQVLNVDRLGPTERRECRAPTSTQSLHLLPITWLNNTHSITTTVLYTHTTTVMNEGPLVLLTYHTQIKSNQIYSP